MRRVTVWALFGIAVAESAAGVTGALVTGMTFEAATESFVVTNTAIGLSLAVAGVLIAWHRPANRVGRLLLAAAVAQAGTAGGMGLFFIGGGYDWPPTVQRLLLTFAAYSWPWSIALFLPLALLLFPDGRLPGPGWRWAARLLVWTSPLFALEMGASPDGVAPPMRGYLVLPFHDRLAPLWTVSELRVALGLLLAVAGLAVRYRRGGELERRQLLWLSYAALVVSVVATFWGLFELGSALILLLIPLVPIAITVAILRHQLLDIRLAVSRTLLYALLTAAVVGAYAGLVTLLDHLVARQVGPGSPALATVVIAVGFNPVRVRLQRLVDRLLYGERADPVRAVSLVGEQLAGPGPLGLGGVVAALCAALRLPFATLRDREGEQAAHGAAPERLHTVPLLHGGERVGELIVGLRAGEHRLAPADARVLALLAVPLAAAVHATGLSVELQRSREHIVAAREEERRRLRRDLHDGLGPVLTGVVYQADAAGNLIANGSPGQAAELVARLRGQVTGAIEDIRRLVYGLRPPALDELGLVGAVRQQADHLALDVAVDAPEDLSRLSAAVEVAAYRIVTEALSNAVRHAGAVRADVRITLADRLEIEVVDRGGDGTGDWRAGVGLRSMRERAAELGGTCHAGPYDGGGRVLARLPLTT
ncbi:MAG: two-component sensor histidine kinase [Nonomuraea sp.]|nr:two-component sensor histidine kinase [Nonomuraea sp.]NUS04658.1 two-component sensor histidine kinase [Nonomuraea sp.]